MKMRVKKLLCGVIRKRKNLDDVNPEVTANKHNKNLHESHNRLANYVAAVQL